MRVALEAQSLPFENTPLFDRFDDRDGIERAQVKQPVAQISFGQAPAPGCDAFARVRP